MTQIPWPLVPTQRKVNHQPRGYEKCIMFSTDASLTCDPSHNTNTECRECVRGLSQDTKEYSNFHFCATMTIYYILRHVGERSGLDRDQTHRTWRECFLVACVCHPSRTDGAPSCHPPHSIVCSATPNTCKDNRSDRDSKDFWYSCENRIPFSSRGHRACTQHRHVVRTPQGNRDLLYINV